MKDCSWLSRAKLVRLGLRLFLGSSHCWSLNIYCDKHAGQNLTCLRLFTIMFKHLSIWNLWNLRHFESLPTHPVLLGFAWSSVSSSPGHSCRCTEGTHPLRHLSHVSHGTPSQSTPFGAQIAASTWGKLRILQQSGCINYKYYSGQADGTGMTTMSVLLYMIHAISCSIKGKRESWVFTSKQASQQVKFGL